MNPIVILLILSALMMTSCTVKAVGDPERPITIKAHVLVDIRELKSTATNIEDRVAEEAAAQESTGLSFLSDAQKILGPSIAYAEGGYDLKTITPEIQSALDRRSRRYNQLGKLKAVGKLGENNEGHISNLSGGPEAATIAKAENADREIIYQAIVKQNNLPDRAIHTVRSVFADVRQQKSKPGEKIQLPNGKWITKS